MPSGPPSPPPPPGQPRRPRPRPAAPNPPPPNEPAALSRRSLLGLGALAGAGAGAAVAGGIAAATDSQSASVVVDANGVPVISAKPQHLSTSQQQQAATNIGAVRTVEPEQFHGDTDDEQLSAAFAALRETGGEIRLRPGKTYSWVRPPQTIDWASHGQVVITAWGSKISYGGKGSAFTSAQTRTVAGTRTLTVLGGEWVAPEADAFFTIVDSGNHLFYRCRGETPAGTFFHLSNRQYWSERNHFIEIEDHNCREVVRFTIDGSGHESFARTVVKDLRLQGGTPGYAKINIVEADGQIQPAPYDSLFDGLVGNIGDGVIIMRLAGGMSGTRISRIQVESQQASTKAAVFQVGILEGHNAPVLLDGPPILRNLILFTADSTTENPFGPNVSLGGLATGGAVSGVPYIRQLPQPGSVTIPADECNVALINLSATCTGSSIDTSLARGQTQQLTIGFGQAGRGGFAYVWPTNCRFARAAAPVDTTPGTQTSVTFVYNDGLWLETARAVAVPAQ